MGMNLGDVTATLAHIGPVWIERTGGGNDHPAMCFAGGYIMVSTTVGEPLDRDPVDRLLVVKYDHDWQVIGDGYGTECNAGPLALLATLGVLTGGTIGASL